MKSVKVKHYPPMYALGYVKEINIPDEYLILNEGENWAGYVYKRNQKKYANTLRVIRGRSK